MPDSIPPTVGDVVAAFLESLGVALAFGVVSVHNIPILDAINRRGRIRFVPARGEAGATNMADAAARVSGSLGVVVTSTGTGAGAARHAARRVEGGVPPDRSRRRARHLARGGD